MTEHTEAHTVGDHIEGVLHALLESQGDDGVITGWVLAYTSMRVDDNGKPGISAGRLVSAHSSPFADVGLATWLADEMQAGLDPLHTYTADDDDDV